MKYAETKPKNPNRAIREFFGTYHDPQWEAQAVLNEELIVLRNENPKLMDKVLELEEELAIEKRNFKIRTVYRGYEPDQKTGLVSTKQIVEKLSGIKKFDVDEKLGLPEFTKLLENTCEGDTQVVDLLLEHLEESLGGTTIFKDDLENPIYKRLVQVIKEMKKTKK